MTRYFVPYDHENPLAIDIKGHRLILLSSDRENLALDLKKIGGDDVREIHLRDEPLEQSQELTRLAASVGGGVVITPPGVSISSMIRNLENELPWIH